MIDLNLRTPNVERQGELDARAAAIKTRVCLALSKALTRPLRLLLCNQRCEKKCLQTVMRRG